MAEHRQMQLLRLSEAQNNPVEGTEQLPYPAIEQAEQKDDRSSMHEPQYTSDR